ncbi:major facilitator superfamily domain-containing protein [Kalaharituber pfeilii]|nr:major facilitator superfamily domain-containing protein [Kalaharituber pfeilii]
MGFLRKQKLGTRDDKVTNASDLTFRESIVPLCLVTILFFLWGFAYGLLDVLNKHFQVALNISRAKSSGLQAAYFGAYPVASLTFAGYILKRYGYKPTFMTGLCLYGVGALLFWPSGVKRSFGGFCGATFVIGSGLGTLESAANPYLAVCGPPKYADMRLNLAQAVQAVGTVVGPVLASQVFFKNVNDTDLGSVQWVYLGIAIFVFLLAAVFYFAPIPEITDADMERQAQIMAGMKEGQNGQSEEREVKPILHHWSLLWATFAQFCYVGAQVAVASYFVNYVTEVRSGTSNSMGANFLAIAQGCFAIGRFIGSGVMKFILPRKALLIFFSGVVVFQALSVGLRGNIGLSMISLLLFWESICFPTIFTLGIKGLGKHTKTGATFIISSIIGGAVVPPLLGVAADSFNDTGRAMIVPLAFFICGYSYPLAVNFYPRLRQIVDDYSGRMENAQSDDKELGLDAMDDEKPGVTLTEGDSSIEKS